jgi:hypothetical protein
MGGKLNRYRRPRLAGGGAVSGGGNVPNEAADDPQHRSPAHPHGGWDDNATKQEYHRRIPNILNRLNATENHKRLPQHQDNEPKSRHSAANV